MTEGTLKLKDKITNGGNPAAVGAELPSVTHAEAQPAKQLAGRFRVVEITRGRNITFVIEENLDGKWVPRDRNEYTDKLHAINEAISLLKTAPEKRRVVVE